MVFCNITQSKPKLSSRDDYNTVLAYEVKKNSSINCMNNEGLRWSFGLDFHTIDTVAITATHANLYMFKPVSILELEVGALWWLDQLPIVGCCHFLLQLCQYVFHGVLPLPVRQHAKLLWFNLKQAMKALWLETMMIFPQCLHDFLIFYLSKPIDQSVLWHGLPYLHSNIEKYYYTDDSAGVSVGQLLQIHIAMGPSFV